MKAEKELLEKLGSEQKRLKDFQNTLAAQSSRRDRLPIKMTTETYLQLLNLAVEALKSRLGISHD